MEVMVGSPFGIGMEACVRDRTGVSAQDKTVPAAALFSADEPGRGGSPIGFASRIGLRMNRKSPEESSEDSSSSIGECSENEEEEEDDAVSFQRGGGGGTLVSFTSSLEDSLPIKRGLSNHYVGKSKSFGNLTEPTMNINAKDLEKGENPFNKRRRLLIANKLRSRGRSMSVSNFYSWQNPNSMSLLAVQEHNEVNHHNDDDDYGENEGDDQTIKLSEKRNMLMKNKRDLMAQTQSCFCLSSLQEEDDDDDEGGVDDE